VNDTETLADAVTAPAACEEHERASAPRPEAAVATVLTAWAASAPFTLKALRSVGKFFATVACSAVSCVDADAVQSRATVGGVHLALAFT
jgi:hypothetical protein